MRKSFLRRASAVRSEAGQIFPLVALAAIVLLGVLGLVVDIGNAELHKHRLQQAVDLGALAAASDLPNQHAAQDEGKALINTNWQKTDSTNDLTVQSSVACMQTGCDANNGPYKVTFTATAKVQTYFTTLFGIDHFTIKRTATACGPCSSTPVVYDVMVVVDRSYSMCEDDNGTPFGTKNGHDICTDLDSAVAGVKQLMTYFDPKYDLMGLTTLGPSDDKTPTLQSSTGTGAYPYCDGADETDNGKKVGSTTMGSYYKTVGDFMDRAGNPSAKTGTVTAAMMVHDSWVLNPLANTFKDSSGNIATTVGTMGYTLNCLQHKYWTPMAPAVYEAATALQQAANTRTVNGTSVQVKKIMVYFGDGGGNTQPMQRDTTNGKFLTGTNCYTGPISPGSSWTSPTCGSWYSPTTGNNLRPCHDAVQQAALAKAAGITIYTIGYDLNASDSNVCKKLSTSGSQSVDDITATATMQQMASSSSTFLTPTAPGDLTNTFTQVGHQITSGGRRLIQ